VTATICPCVEQRTSRSWLKSVNNFSKPLKSVLSEAGWRYLRPGKGDHEIWHEPSTGRKVVVDNSMKSRHTANAVLKQAGLPKAF
jgi:predicted RNA binding protein YcfA (HicA-like mRNA interferase family)